MSREFLQDGEPMTRHDDLITISDYKHLFSVGNTENNHASVYVMEDGDGPCYLLYIYLGDDFEEVYASQDHEDIVMVMQFIHRFLPVLLEAK